MVNLRILHRKITVLGFVTLFFEWIIAFLVEMGVWRACPPVSWKILKLWKKIVQIKCKKSLKSKKKQTFFNAAGILDTGGDEKQVFFFGVALHNVFSKICVCLFFLFDVLLAYIYVCIMRCFLFCSWRKNKSY